LQTKWRPVSEQPDKPEPFAPTRLPLRIFIPPRSSWQPPDPNILDIEVPEIVAEMLLKRTAYALVAGEIEFTDMFAVTHVTGFAYAVFFTPEGESSASVYGRPAYWQHTVKGKNSSEPPPT
jgi:hypothetical protein